jgi:hypothetical protein
LRRRDRRYVWPAFRALGAHFDPDDEEAALLRAMQAWAIFIQAPGQEHFRCGCHHESEES